MKEEILLNDIERLRENLNNLLYRNKDCKLCDIEFIYLSQILDELIVDYMKNKTKDDSS